MKYASATKANNFWESIPKQSMRKNSWKDKFKQELRAMPYDKQIQALKPDNHHFKALQMKNAFKKQTCEASFETIETIANQTTNPIQVLNKPHTTEEENEMYEGFFNKIYRLDNYQPPTGWGMFDLEYIPSSSMFMKTLNPKGVLPSIQILRGTI